MSYDIDIGDREFNYTFNMSKLFYDHIPNEGKGGGIRELADITGAVGVTVIAAALSRLADTVISMGETPMRAKYDAENKWGSTLGAVIWLGGILSACVDNPNEIIKVSM